MTIRARAGLAVLGVALMGAASPPPSAAQEIIELRLEATFPEGFGHIGAIRPTSDGRVIVADPLGQVLLLIDLDTGNGERLGREGGGPGEYRQPDSVFPLPGDSTLLLDLGNGRLSVMGPDGAFGRTIPLARETASGALSVVIPRYVDGQGRFYYQAETVTGGPVPDSAWIARFDLSTARIDTVAAIKLADPADHRRGARMMLGRVPLGAQDDWAVAEDGTVVIVRARDYSVARIRPGNGIVDGPPNEYHPYRVGTSDKEAWTEEFFTAQISMGIRRSADGTRQVTFSRGTQSRDDPDLDAYDWPDRLPPFRAGRTMVAPDHRAWVERYVPVGEAPIVDVFDADGVLASRVELPVGRRVAGFTDRAVYLVRTDRYGLQWLERYLILGGVRGR